MRANIIPESNYFDSKEDFKSSLESGLNTLSALDWVEAQAIDAYRQALSQLLDVIGNGLPLPVIPEQYGWGEKKLLTSHDVEAGVAAVFGHQPMTLHDHPGSSGLLLALEGSVTIYQYTRHDSGNRDSGPYELCLSSMRTLEEGDFAVFSPESGNIHTMCCEQGKRAVLFDVVFPPFDKLARSWYLPLARLHRDQTIIKVRRLSRKRP